MLGWHRSHTLVDNSSLIGELVLIITNIRSPSLTHTHTHTHTHTYTTVLRRPQPNELFLPIPLYPAIFTPPRPGSLLFLIFNHALQPCLPRHRSWKNPLLNCGGAENRIRLVFQSDNEAASLPTIRPIRGSCYQPLGQWRGLVAIYNNFDMGNKNSGLK